MDFLFKHYQHITDSFQQMLWFINAFLHLLFAGAVAKDCGQMHKRGLKPILVSPAAWAFTALLGGVWAAAVYWLLHHSTLTISSHKETRESK